MSQALTGVGEMGLQLKSTHPIRSITGPLPATFRHSSFFRVMSCHVRKARQRAPVSHCTFPPFPGIKPFVSCRIRTIGHVFLVFATAYLITLRSSGAYEVPLKPAAIHEAYVLGQRNDHLTADFLHPYISECSPPEESCFITQIEMLTPFAQVVELSRRNATKGYTEQQAVHDYRQGSGKIIVQITLVLRAAYAGAANKPPINPPPEENRNASLRPENFWQNFRFSLKQQGKVIATRSIRNEPIYSTPTKDAPPVLDGATVQLEYDSKDVASEETKVEVLTPESKTITASFDLKKLR
jgi:hypothetical protein